MALVDLNDDGDSKLVIADLTNKLIVYSGTKIYAEHTILATPTAAAVFYSANTTVRIFIYHFLQLFIILL